MGLFIKKYKQPAASGDKLKAEEEVKRRSIKLFSSLIMQIFVQIRI